jgi:tetratricopeptide (TPR) repeat protein
MEAKERRQLKTNELAEALMKLREFGRDRQTQYWALGLAVVAVLFASYKLWGRMQEHQLASAWSRLSGASRQVFSGSPTALEELRTLIQKAPNPTVSANARIRLAAGLRQQAEQTPAQRTELLEEAATVLKPLLEDPQIAPPLVAAAAFSLATCYESLGRIDDAGQLYRMLSSEARFAGTVFPILAADRLSDLDELRVKLRFEPGEPPAAAAPPTTAFKPSEPKPQVTLPPELSAQATPSGPPEPAPPAPSEPAQPTSQPVDAPSP